MRISKKTQVIIAGIIPLLILMGMTIMPLMTLFFGEEILLETIPYDPRDIFRGDYVRLNYKINEVDIDKFPQVLRDGEAYEKYRNKRIYAVLKKEDKYYVVDYMTYQKPKDRVYLTSKLASFYQFQNPNPDTSENKIHINYNLDKYFVPENTGKHLEDMSQRGELAAKIKVLNGNALLMEVTNKIN